MDTDMEGADSLRERALIERFRDGDADAFADLVRPWYRRLLGYLARLCGDAALADDLLQETLIRVWRGLKSYDDRKRFGSWLFTIAHHVTIDHRRRRARARDEVCDIPEPVAPTDPARELMARELGELLADAVERLPEKQRRVFLLRQHGTLKFREIAELTDEPLSTVLGHMSYATEKLQRIVRQYHARG
jgi:RNA polymerase sigma-70 factor (ECF subfamily)